MQFAELLLLHWWLRAATCSLLNGGEAKSSPALPGAKAAPSATPAPKSQPASMAAKRPADDNATKDADSGSSSSSSFSFGAKKAAVSSATDTGASAVPAAGLGVAFGSKSPAAATGPKTVPFGGFGQKSGEPSAKGGGTTSRSSPAASGGSAVLDQDVQLHALNKAFLAHISAAVSKDSTCDLSPCVEDYLKHAKQIEVNR